MSNVASEQKPAPAGAFNQAIPAPVSAAPPGTHDGYLVQGKDSKQGYGAGKWPEYQKWQAWGNGEGDRKGDRPDEKGVVANATVTAPKVAQADLRDIHTTPRGQAEGKAGAGTYHDSLLGTTYSYLLDAQKPSVKIDPATLKPVFDGYSARAAAGIREKYGVRGLALGSGDLGTAQVKGDGYAIGELGADAYARLNSKDGAVIGANASGKLGVGASGDLDLNTSKLSLAGVDRPLQAGVGVHGEAFAGGKLGAGGRAGLGPNFTGGEVSLGAFAGGEAQGDVHANLGPVGGRLTGSLIAGAGLGADGGITYDKGQLKFGARAYAALGYGGSVGGEVTIDIKQATQLALAAGKKGFELADGDKDGKLTLNDPATHLASAAKGGAKLLDRGATGLINLLDADGSGKFTSDDLKIRLNQAGDSLGAARDRVLAGGKQLLDKGQKALDRDGDGQLSFGDVKAGAGQLKDAAVSGLHKVEDTVAKGARRLHDAADHDGDGKVDLGDVKAYLGDAGTAVLKNGKQVIDTVGKAGTQAKDWVVDQAGQAGKAAHDALDADGDGKLSLHDARTIGQHAYKDLSDAGKSVKEHAQQVMHEVHDAVDLNHDGKVDSADALAAGKKVAQTARAAKQLAVDTFNRTVTVGAEKFEAAKQKAAQIGHAAHKAADLDGDGQLGWNDVRTGAGQVNDAVVERAKQAGAIVQHAADRDGDGKLGWNDVRAGAGQVKEAVVERASALYGSAKDQVTHAASTVREGFSSAASTVKGTWNRVGNFFGF